MFKSKFQTIVELPDFPKKTGYGKKNMFLGSCFTENIGSRMEDLAFSTDINPFGIVYNPMSLARVLRRLISAYPYEEVELVEWDNKWHSFDHHGRFSGKNPVEVLQHVNDRLNDSASFLRGCDFLFVTFGTSWVYIYKKSEEIVSNCHKIPANNFMRERLGKDQIVSEYSELLEELWEFNPGLNIVFTVSPVRHWKDGAIENQRSKAALILSVDELCRKYPGKCFYFPSYEIVMDELRDYRFYSEDMLHISDVAVDHIWERFEEKLVDAESREIAPKVKKIRRALDHRPFDKFTKEYLLFLSKQGRELDKLEKAYPRLTLDKEKKILHARINEVGDVID